MREGSDDGSWHARECKKKSVTRRSRNVWQAGFDKASVEQQVATGLQIAESVGTKECGAAATCDGDREQSEA